VHDGYLMPWPIVPYQGSRGCHWGICGFCDHEEGYRLHYRPKDSAQVVDHMEYLRAQHGITHLQFVDEAIEPQWMTGLNDEIEARSLSGAYRWSNYSKIAREVDYDSLSRSYRNGCRLVLFGVESFQQRVLNVVRKGIRRNDIFTTLHDARRAGIRSWIWLISGLHLALHMTAGAGRAARPGEPPEGEVLTTALTCTATNWPILANGLRIRWIDVDPATLNVDLDDVARKISPATRAIVVVHWAGYPLDLDRLRGILDAAEARHGFRPAVIEDCAHAWGSTYRGQPLGNHGNIAVYSFQAIKSLTTGDGGVVVFPTEELAERAKILRWYGIDRRVPEGPRLTADIPEYGFKFHMNDINAAIGLANLPSVDARVARHQENAA
jgi:hypothetical protein